MINQLPDDIQWYIWLYYYKQFVMNELEKKIIYRQATYIQTIIKLRLEN